MTPTPPEAGSVQHAGDGIPLAALLRRLVLLCVVPLMLVASWLAWHDVRSDQVEYDQDATRLAGNCAALVDQYLDARIRALNLLAVSPLVQQPGRWQELYQEAQGFRESFDSHVILAEVGQPMQMRFNTRVPFGTTLPPLPVPRGRAAAPQAVATGKPAVGDRFLGPVAKTPLVAVAVPVLRGGRPVYVLVSTFEAALFQKRLDQVALPAGWALALVDGTGETIARRAQAGVSQGARRVVARTSLARWTVVLEIPDAVYRRPLLVTAATLAGGILVATLIGLCGGMAAARRLEREVAELAQQKRVPGRPPIREFAAAGRLIAQAQAEVRDSEERFRRLFQLAPLSLCFVTREGVIQDRNACFERVVGYTDTELKTAADWWPLAYPDPEYRRQMQANWRAALGTGFPGDGAARECRITCRDGQERVMLVSSIALQDGILVSFFDMTGQRRAEAGLRLWAESFERADFALAITDHRDNTFVAVNPAYARARGYLPEELAGRAVGTVFPPERMPELQASLAALERESHGVFESEHICKDGRRFPVLLDVTVCRALDGIPQNRVIYALDITDRKHAEKALLEAQSAALEAQSRARIAALNQMEDAIAARKSAEAALAALRESERLLAAMGRAAHIGGWELDLESGVSQWTKEVPRICECDLPCAPGRQFGLELCRGESRGRLEAAQSLALRQGTPYDLELEITSGRGTRKWIRTICEPLVEGGRVVRLRGSVQDITERKLAQLEILTLNAELEQRIEERTAKLAAANQELDSFAYAVSHDLRAPLRALIGFSRALVEDYGPQLKGEAALFLEQIVQASRQMGQLIDGLLALSRTTRGALRRESVDLSAMAGHIRTNLERAEPERRVEWEIEEGLKAEGDGRMLESVLQNLLGNAFKYSSKTPAARIRFFAVEREGQRFFCISDNGAGFSMDHAARLFKPFQRLHRQDEFAGIGIGLATVLRIIERHGGVVEAEAEPGRGALFRFSLPPAA
jgi:PAS domain S-box-containing protein